MERVKPHSAPSRIYWVEAKYGSLAGRDGRPMGGKFTRLDSARNRCKAIRDSGGQSNIYVHRMEQWEKLEERSSP